MSSLLPDSFRDQDAPPRSLVEALREEPIEPARIERAYARFLREGAAAPGRWRGPRVVRYAAFAMLMAVGTVYAATVMKPLTSAPPPPVASPPAETRTSPARPTPSPKAAKVVEENAASETEEPTPEAAPPVALPSPTAAPVREQPARSPTPAPSAEQWKRAAQGLRDGDYQSANAALKELTRKGTEAERESAQLVQAQVLLAQGREGEAQRLLKSLEGSARAPSVRRKSVELLARLRDRPAARADKARGVTESP